MALYAEAVREVQNRALGLFESAKKADIHVPEVEPTLDDSKIQVVFIGENVQNHFYKILATHDPELGKEMNLNAPKITVSFPNPLLKDDKITYGMVSGVIQHNQRTNILEHINNADVVVLYSARSIQQDILSLISESDILTRIMLTSSSSSATYTRVPKIIFINANLPSDTVATWETDVQNHWDNMITQAQMEISDPNNFSSYVKKMRTYKPVFVHQDHEAFSFLRFGKPNDLKSLRRLLQEDKSLFDICGVPRLIREIQQVVGQQYEENTNAQYMQRFHYIKYAIQNESKRVLTAEVYDLLIHKPVHALYNDQKERILFSEVQKLMKDAIPTVTPAFFDITLSLPKDFASKNNNQRYQFARSELKFATALVSNDVNKIKRDSINELVSAIKKFSKTLVQDLFKDPKRNEGDLITFKKDLGILVEDALKFLKKPVHAERRNELEEKVNSLMFEFSQLTTSGFETNPEGTLKKTMEGLVNNDKIKLGTTLPVKLVEGTVQNSTVIQKFTLAKEDPLHYPLFDAIAHILLRKEYPSPVPRRGTKSENANELAIIMLRKCLYTNKKKDWLQFFGYILYPAGFSNVKAIPQEVPLRKLLDDFFFVQFSSVVQNGDLAVVQQQDNSCSIVKINCDEGESSSKKPRLL